MNDKSSSGLTVVGGRPDDQGEGSATISAGLQNLLQRLAENPQLAHDLVMDPQRTLSAEGLTLAPTELAMLRHLDTDDLGQARAATQSATRGAPTTRGFSPQDSEEVDETRRRLADQLKLVAPFVGDPDFYLSERTRGIRPQSIFPTPFAVAEALLRTNDDFRIAFMLDPRRAVRTQPDLPLNDEERRSLLSKPILQRLIQIARDA